MVIMVVLLGELLQLVRTKSDARSAEVPAPPAMAAKE
jgi:hypothetical protein